MASSASGSMPVDTRSKVISVPRARVESVDLLRGVVMVLMALDHTREFFSYVRVPPEFVAQSTLPLFFTRWITHFCAPAFFFLAGTGAFMSASRGKKTSELASFLVKRGAWLILLEFTIIDFGWSFVPGFIFAGVLYALGACMIILALLVWLPVRWIAVISLGGIVFHHLFDKIQPEAFGPFKYVWILLHQPGVFPIRLPDIFLLNLYVLVPWCFVMGAGYAFGLVLLRPPEERRRWMLGIGAVSTALFFVLRFTNWWGQPPEGAGFIPFTVGPYVPQATVAKSIIAFFNVNKYPPSFQFLLMTLGPSLMAMAWFDRLDLNASRNWFWRKVLVYGQVPMFYYVLHIWFIHILAIILAVVNKQSYRWLFHGAIFAGPGPSDVYGYGLPVIYVIWALVVISLYPACAWFAQYKKTHKQWWLRYV